MKQDMDIDEVLDAVIDRATIGNTALSVAQEKWKQYRLIQKQSDFGLARFNLSEERETQLSDRAYFGALRLIEECGKLQEHIRQIAPSEEHEVEDANISLVVDADLYSDYAQIDTSAEYSFRGYHFLADKIESVHEFNIDNIEQNAERDGFVALLTEIFKLSRPKAITQAGKSELANLPGILLRMKEDSPRVDYQYERLETAARSASIITDRLESELSRIKTVSQFFKLDEMSKAARTNEAFIDIIRSIAVPSGINNYILARLNTALKYSEGTLANVTATVARELRESGNAIDAHDFEYVVRRLRHDRGPELNAAKRSIENAYQCYLSTYFGTKRPLSYGAIQNLSALFEIHLANCVLDKLSIDHEARYIHKNDLVFGFLRGFPRGRISVPSIHPRFTFFYTRPAILFQEIGHGASSLVPAEHLQVASVLVSSFEARMLQDEKISAEEYAIFSGKIQKILIQIQEMHASLLIDAGEFEEEKESRRTQAQSAKKGLVNHFQFVLEKCSQYSRDWKRNDESAKKVDHIDGFRKPIESCLESLDKITPQLEESLLLTRVSLFDGPNENPIYRKNPVYSSSSLEQIDQILKSLNSISQENMKSDHAKMLVTFYRYRNKGHPLRTTCIPLAGGYRYLFALHGTKLARHLGALFDSEKNKVDIHEFCSAAIEYCDKELSKLGISVAERTGILVNKYLISAFQSAALRNWGLALTLVETSLGYLRDFETRPATKEKNEILMAQKVECFSMMQFAQRALSEETHSKKRKRRYLRAAVASLSEGLQTLNKVDAAVFQIDTPILPHSIRLYNARIATELERDVNIHRGYLDHGEILDWSAWLNADADFFPSIQKEQVEILANGKGKLELTKKYECLEEVSRTILEQLLVVDAQVSEGQGTGHRVSMWDYFALRAAQTYDLVQIVRFLLEGDPTQKFLDQKSYSQNVFPQLKKIQKRYVASSGFKQNESANLGNSKFGLMAAIHFYYLVAKQLGKDKDAIPDSSMGSDFRKLELACSSLVQTGIPRFLVSHLKMNLMAEIKERNANRRYESSW